MNYPNFVQGEQEQKDFSALLKAHNADGGLIPYVGAGFSFGMPDVLGVNACPSWSGFLWQLFEQYQNDLLDEKAQQFKGLMDKGKFELALQILVDTIGNAKFKDDVEQTFAKPVVGDFPPTFKRKFELFHSAFKGPWLTTNMDGFIEASYTELTNNSGAQLEVVQGFKDPRFITDLNRSDLSGYLFKLHGSAKNKSSLVFTHNDYVQAYGHETSFDINADLPQTLKRLFTNHSLLFIGCSLSIDRPMMILEQLAKNEGVKHQFALLKRSDFTGDCPDKKDARNKLHHLYITPIWLDDFDDIETVLERLAPEYKEQQQEPAPEVFVGREEELELLINNITQAGSLFTITDAVPAKTDSKSQLHHLVGEGGVGKTTLARKVLACCKQHFPDGAFEIRIDSKSPIAFAKSLSDKLGLPPEYECNTNDEGKAFITDLLTKKRLLLLLDNVDSGEVLLELLPDNYSSCVIVTSRDTELEDFIRIRRGNLHINPINLEKFTDNEALELFEKILGPKYVPQQQATYLAIAKQLQHLPIALRLAINTMLSGARKSATQLLTALENNQHLQVTEQGASLSVNEQERSLLAVFDLSAPILSQELKYYLAIIAVCEQGPVPADFVEALHHNLVNKMPDEVAEAILGKLGLSEPDLNEQSFIENMHLLERYQWCKRYSLTDDDGNEQQYIELHQLVRQIVTKQLIEQHFKDVPFEEAFARLVFDCFALEGQEPVGFKILDRWIEQTKKAALWLKQHRPNDFPYWASEKFWQYCVNRGFGERFITISQWVIESDVDNAHKAMAMGNQANILLTKGQLAEALKLHQQEQKLEESLMAKNADDKRRLKGLASCYGNQAIIFEQQGQYEQAMGLYQQQQSIVEAIDDKEERQESLTYCYANQAGLLIAQEKLEEAMALLKKQQDICDLLTNKAVATKLLSGCLFNQSVILEEQKKFDEAMALYKQSLLLKKQLGDIGGEGQTLWYMARTYMKQHEYQQGISLKEQAIALLKASGRPTAEHEQELEHLKLWLTGRKQKAKAVLTALLLTGLLVGLVVYL